MITDKQADYLSKLPPEQADREVSISPFSPQMRAVAIQIGTELANLLPGSHQYFLGSAALEIAGENDIDIVIVSSGNFENDKLTLIRSYGQPVGGKEGRYSQWEFDRNGYKIDLSLNSDIAPPLQEQIDFHEILVSDPALKSEYNDLKLKMNGKTYKEYQTAKYEFFNRVLSEKSN